MIDVYRLEEIREEIEMLREEAMDIMSEVRSQGHVRTYERAYRGWNAEIEIALSSSNQWLGQITMDNLEQTIETLEALSDEGEEEAA
jgi:uncharacterized protein (UPF0335 family)